MGWKISYVEPVLFLFSITLFLNIPTERQLIFRKVCLKHYNETFCDMINSPNNTNGSSEENIVHEETAQWGMYSNLVRIVPTIFATINLGYWSDRFGRKNIMSIAVFGETISAISFFLNAWYFSAPITYIFLGHLITGLCGNFSAILMSALAYLGDTTSEDKRTIRIVILDVLTFLASTISFFGSGILLDKFGFLYVYAVDIGIYVIIIIYLWCLEESHYPNEEVKIKDILCRHNYQNCMEYVRLFAQKRSPYHYVKVALFFGCLIGLFFVTSGIDNILLLYLLHTPLSFTAESIGFVLTSESIVKFVGALFGTTVLVKIFKCRDVSLISLAAVAAGAYALCLAFSREKYEIYLSTLCGLGVCGGAAACRAGLSKVVSAAELGKLNSVVCVSQELCFLLGSVTFNSIYKETVHISPSFTLYVIGGFSIFPIVFSFFLRVYCVRDDYAKANGYQAIE